MATNQASASEQVSAARGGGRHTDKVALDRNLFCPRLELLLCTSAQQRGLRGTLASVTASIERGGAGGGSEDPNLQMLQRIGWQRGVHDGYDSHRAPVYRLERLEESERRWRLLEPAHQATLIARYIYASTVDETLRARFGVLAGVVFFRWLRRCADDRNREIAPRLQVIEQKLEQLRLVAVPLEHEQATLRTLPRRPPAAVFADLDASKPTKPPAPEPTGDEKQDAKALTAWRSSWLQDVGPNNAERRARRAVLAFLTAWRTHEADERLGVVMAELRPLRASIAELLVQRVALSSAGGVEADSRQLLKLCQQGEPPKALLEKATDDTTAAHRAWYATGRAAAKAWVDEGAPA